MPDTCPHCGSRLPNVVDAFCPECRKPLREAPPPLADTARGDGFGLGLLAILAGSAAMVVGLVALLRGNLADAIYTGGIGLLIAVGGIVAFVRAPPK